jgi:hypothetical protein
VIAASLSSSEQAFYATAAQVIPVFMLALALELPSVRAIGRFLEADRTGAWMWRVVQVVIFVIVVLMFGAEVVAILNLRDDRAARDDDVWVTLGFIAGAIPVFLAVLERLLPEVTRASRAGDTPAAPRDDVASPEASNRNDEPGT